MSTQVTVKNYKSVLASAVKSEKLVAEKIQAVLVLGFHQVAEHGNLTVLSDVVNSTGTMRNKATRVVTAYIHDHVKGIHWNVKDKKYNKVKAKGSKIVVSMPEYPFWEHTSMEEQGRVITFDANKNLATFMRKLDEKQKEGALKVDAHSLRRQAERLVAMAEAMEKAPEEAEEDVQTQLDLVS